MNSKKNCVFTIVAKNYIGLAQILGESIKKYYKDFDFFIIVADEIEGVSKDQMPSNVIIGKENLNFNIDVWEDMSFKYTITEFCTSIKPASILFFLERGYEKVIYLDPDIYFYSSIQPIFDELNDYSIILTPHILTIPNLGETDSPESDWMLCGIYNLGFCAFKNTAKTRRILEWWNERLINHCFMDNSVGEFTDQKWIDFLPAFLSSNELLISRDKGRNVAPWNYFERRIVLENNEIWVANRINNDSEQKFRLMFVHYSGYDYLSLMDNYVIQKNIAGIRNYEDLKILIDYYKDNLNHNRELIIKYLCDTYTYNTFNNGIKIDPIHRRIYAGLRNEGYQLNHPFSADCLFYNALKKAKLLNLNASDLVKMNPTSIAKSNYKNKIESAKSIFSIIYKILGARRFFMMIRMFSAFRHIKVHTYLLKSYIKRNN